jgi:hypothetical protein
MVTRGRARRHERESMLIGIIVGKHLGSMPTTPQHALEVAEYAAWRWQKFCRLAELAAETNKRAYVPPPPESLWRYVESVMQELAFTAALPDFYRPAG